MGTLGILHCFTLATKTKDLKSKTFFLILGGGGLFCPIFRNHFFSLELYLGDQLCSKCTKKDFVSYWLMGYRPIKIIS